jgi:hypothetical protein
MNETIPPIPGNLSQPKTSALAIWSLILGVIGLLLLLICIGPLFAIPGVICGHMAYSRIKHSSGALAGQGMALAGLITGYVSIGLSAFLLPMMMAIAIPNFVKARDTSMMNACINNLRQPFFKSGVFPVCPAGGIYTIGAVSNAPACSIPGHKLPQ